MNFVESVRSLHFTQYKANICQNKLLIENVVVSNTSVFLKVPIWKFLVHFRDILKCGQIWACKDKFTLSQTLATDK